MTISLDSIPRFTAAEALAVAQREYDIAGPVSRLPSERDQNFLIDDPQRGKVVLKIANRHDTPELLQCQNLAMRRVANSPCACRVQEIVLARTGEEITSIHHEAGTRHCVRALNWIDGEVLAKCAQRGAGLFDSIGANMAKIDAALRDFTHPAAHRVLQWDLRHSGLARAHVRLLPRARRARIERAFALWEEIDWGLLRHGVIHGDANDYNVLTADGRMTGLLDFGDMVHSATVCELAIAVAYAMLHHETPFAAAAEVIGGYQRHYPLTDPEQRVLFPLIIARLSASVCYAAHNRVRNPDDTYQVVTEAAAWTLLDALEPCSNDAAFAIVRAACQSAASHPV
jgi:Ser/Thr protein kinase RdoA (MazF antagonist)